MANEATERVLESRIQLRNDTAENWASVDPVLLKGEIGIELDRRRFRWATELRIGKRSNTCRTIS